MTSRVTSAVHGPTDSPPGCPCETEANGPFAKGVARVVSAHRALLIRVARHEGLQGEDALDAVQEALGTFLTLPAARTLPDATDDARNLLVAITRNAARNRRRLAAVSRPHVSDDALLGTLESETPDAEQRLAASEQQTQLRSCVERLGDVQRAVVTLRLLDELDGDDVARALGITRSHVAVLLHRAKANLHACMTGDG